MKLLLDTCVWGGLVTDLREAGHDVVWTGQWERDPRDEVILMMAREQGRALVTLDKDFGEMAVVRGMPHCGIVRLVNLSTSQQAKITKRVLDLHGEELGRGALITATDKRLRIRAGPR